MMKTKKKRNIYKDSLDVFKKVKLHNIETGDQNRNKQKKGNNYMFKETHYEEIIQTKIHTHREKVREKDRK